MSKIIFIFIFIFATWIPLIFCTASSSTVLTSTVTGGSTSPVSKTTVLTSTVTPLICEDSDGSEKCKNYKDYCSNPIYYGILRGKCDKTCGFCGGGTTVAPKCVDFNKKCEQWVKNGYCTNSFYKCADRKKNCEKSCKLCNTVC